MVVGALGEQNRIVEPQQISSGASHSDLQSESGGDVLGLLHSLFPVWSDRSPNSWRVSVVYHSPGQP